MLVLVARASLIRCLVTHGLMALGAALVVGLAEASVAGGEGGELMDTLGGKPCSCSGG